MNTSDTFALIVFFLIAALGTMGTVLYCTNPFGAFKRFSESFGIDFQKLNGSAEEGHWLKRFFQYFGSLLLGANYFAFFSAWMAFHEHIAIAWWSLSYFPIMFLWHFFLTKKVMKEKMIQLFFLLLCTSALALTWRTAGI